MLNVKLRQLVSFFLNLLKKQKKYKKGKKREAAGCLAEVSMSYLTIFKIILKADNSLWESLFNYLIFTTKINVTEKFFLLNKGYQ